MTPDLPKTAPDAEAWREGHAVLRDRIHRLPAVIRTQRRATQAELGLPRGVRCVVASGVGSSEAHARYLVHLLAAHFGLPARFAPLSSLAVAAPSGSERDALVVFSQGLSPNARLALRTPEAWRSVVLATAVTEPCAARVGCEGPRQVLEHLAAAGGTVVRFSEPDEYTTLVRVVGPMSGYLCALDLARAFANVIVPPQELDRETESIALALESAQARFHAALGPHPLPSLCDGLALLASGEHGELLANLRYKVLEGLLSPLPPVWDLLHFAHGPFQQAYSHPGTFVALTRPDAPGEPALLSRLHQMRVPGRHAVLELPSVLAGPLALFDHEAQLNHLMLFEIERRHIDQVRWPGKGLDAPLYDLGAEAPPSVARPSKSTPRVRANKLEALTWPELEALREKGPLTALLPLGATEQHGPHLPFATDTWIADALAERFCARVPEAVALPALHLGCSSEHLAFPGTLSLEPATLRAVIANVLESCRRHGFARAYVFTAHGGNYGALGEGLLALRQGCAPMRLGVFTDFDRLGRLFHQASAQDAVSAEASGHHAGEFETSILLALRPDAVRQDRLATGFVEPVSDPSALFYPDLRRNAPDGTVGDPRQASAARAERYLDAWVDVLVSDYRADLQGAPAGR